MLSSGVFRECFAAGVANMMSFALGCLTVWVSACRHFLNSDDSPLGTVSPQFYSWASSIPFLSALLGLFMWGNISERFGRKPAGLILGLPMAGMYAILAVTHNQTVVLAARFLGGFSNVGCIMCVTLYVKEISSSKMRSKLTNILTGSIVSGSLFLIILSSVVSYQLIHIIMLIFCVLYLALYSMLPETPVYHIMNENYDKAKQSLQWLRPSKNETELSQEIEALKDTFIKKSSIKFWAIFSNKYYLKTTLIGVFLQTAIYNLTGFSVFVTFSSEIFENLLHETNISWYNIVFTVLQITGAILTFRVADLFGRRTYMVGTCVFLAVVLFALAMYQYLHLQVKVFALSMVYVYILTFCTTCFPIMYIYFNEIISSESSNHIFTVMMMGKNLGWFSTTKMYGSFEDLMGLQGIFLSFSVMNLLVAAIILTFPESKNKTLQTLKGELLTS